MSSPLDPGPLDGLLDGPVDDVSGPSVVVAAESAMVRRVLGSVLTRAGYSVITVADGVAAVQATVAGPAAALVAWVALPQLSGYSVTRLLREDPRTAHVPVVLLTSPGAAAERYWAVRCGANRALGTDVEAHDLVAAVGAELMTQPPIPAASGVPEQDGDVILARAAEVLERVLFETALVAEISGLAVAGVGAQGGMAGLLATVCRMADPALAAVITPQPPLALVAVNAPVSRRHYRDLLLAVADEVGAARGSALDPGSLDARAADPNSLLGSDEQAHLGKYTGIALHGPDGAYVGHLALTTLEEGGFPPRVRSTLDLLTEPAGRLVATLTRGGA